MRHACLACFAAVLSLTSYTAPAKAGPSERSYRMQFEGRQMTVRRIAKEPMVPMTGQPDMAKGPPPSPALRVGGAADPAQALRALEAFCGYPSGDLKDFGAYGDPFWHDRAKGEWVVWFDCEPGQG